MKAVSSGKSIEGKADTVRSCVDVSARDTVLWIGDTEVDVDSAKLLGVNVIALDCGLRTRNYLESLNPYSICSALKDIDLS